MPPVPAVSFKRFRRSQPVLWPLLTKSPLKRRPKSQLIPTARNSARAMGRCNLPVLTPVCSLLPVSRPSLQVATTLTNVDENVCLVTGR